MFPAEVANKYYDAQRLFAGGKAAQALAILDDIAHQAPNHPEIMHARALCLYATGNLREALKLCNQLYTMHRDRRGLELRNRWTNPRWVANTAIQAAETEAAAPAAPPAVAEAAQAVPAPVEEVIPFDVGFLRHAAIVCIGLSAQPRPENAASIDDLPPRLRAIGCTPGDYNDALAHHYEVCMPNAAAVLDRARAAGVPVVMIQFGFVCPDGSDLSPYIYERMKEDVGVDPSLWPGNAGSPEWLPADALHCEMSDRLLHMTGDDAFTSSNLRFVLRNLGVKNIVLLGGPIETRIARTCTTTRERGFVPAIAIDAVSAMRESVREAAIREAGALHTVTAKEILDLLDTLAGNPPA